MKAITKKGPGGKTVIKGYIFDCDIIECESNRTTEEKDPRRPVGWIHLRIDRDIEDMCVEAHLDLCVHHSRHLAELLGPLKWRSLGGGDIITERIVK